MKKNNYKRFLSVLLAICMIFSNMGMLLVYAADTACTCGTQDGNHTAECALMTEEQDTSCTCEPVEGVHQEGCALYEEPECTCEPVEGVHQEGCALYEAPECTCEPVEGVHQEGCAFYEAPECTCEPVEGVHQEGCALYEAPKCTCEPVEGVHQEGCALYEEPKCSCEPVEGVHQEGCALYEAPECTCEPVEGVHQEGCALYEEPKCSCEPVEGVHQEDCALYEAPECTCEPVGDVHQKDCALYKIPVCTCEPVEGIHQEGCMLYISPEIKLFAVGNADAISFEAGIYLDADRTNLAVSLTSEGSTLAGWTYQSESVSAEDRYLGITLSDLPMDSDKQYQLVVEMAPILFINQNSDPSLSKTSVTFTKNEDLTVNTDGKYILNQYSLSNLTYLIDSGTEGLTFGLPLRFDVKLWDKQNGGSLGNGTDPLLRVYLQEKQTDGTFETVTGKDVKLAQATVDGSLPYNTGQLYKYLVGGSTSTTVERMGPNDVMRVVQYHFYSNEYSGGHYAETVEVKIKMPTCTVEGETYTAQYKDFHFITSEGSSQFEQVYDEETGILTVTAEKFYFSTCKLFEIYLSIPENMKGLEGVHSFKGEISITENGDVVVAKKGLSFTLDSRTEADIKHLGTRGVADTNHPGAVHYLGTQGLHNAAATVDSGMLLIEQTFDSNNTNLVRVTTVNLLSDSTAKEIEVTYTLVDVDGNQVNIDGQTEFTTTIKNKSSNLSAEDKNNLSVTFRVPEVHRGYYFKTISYVLNNLPANTKAYASSGASGTSAAGTIWGYVLADTIPNTFPQHSMKVSQYNADGTTGKVWVESATVSTNIDEGKKVAYGLFNAKVSSSSVTAGDSVTISAQVQVSSYPYASNSCLDNIRLGLILPTGITVNESAITATYKDKSSLGVSSVSQKTLNDGNILYIIAFEQGKPIGYYSESLGSLPVVSNYIDFSIQLNSDKTISMQTIKLVDNLFVAGLGLENGASGAWQYYVIDDYYDLNDNESTTDKVGCFKSNVTTSITFNASPAELAITDELVNKDGEANSSQTIETFADILNYNLHIECTEGGSASEFYYMIPIAKTSIDSDPVFVEKCQVDLALADEAVVTTSKGTPMKVLYSTTPIAGYSDTLDLTDWSETLPDGKDWSHVTAIKVVSAEENIENGSVNVISVPLKYAGKDTDYEHMAGYQIQWSSRGYYHYQVGYNSNSGTQSTKGCTITLTYTPQEPVKFTLTAAKGGKPISGESTYTLDLQILFYLAQEYRVKEITPYNVNLKGADYDFTTATSAEANENFRIKISVKAKDNENVSEAIALEKDNDIIGKLDEHSIPVFTFTIENADALSDIVTDRKVTLTLIGSNGVIIPVEITIKRELAAAEPTTSAIVAGKLYAPFEGAQSTTVSNDSAFTAQFVTEYIPANYTNHAIVFEHALAKDTTIIMIDWTDPSGLKYYHHTMNGSTNTVALTAFQGMGNSNAFSESTNTNQVIERLLFIVSFPDGGEALRNNTMKLTKNLQTDTASEASTELKFTTVAKRAFSLTSSKTSVMCGDDFEISYTSRCSVTDSRYTNRNLSLVIKPSDGTTFPVDACLTVDGTSYYLNDQGNFIVPLKGVQTGDGSAIVSFRSQTMSQISLQVSLWASATANGSKPLMGDQVVGPVTVAVSAKMAPSFKVVDMSSRLLEVADLSNTITVNFEQRNSTNVTIELQKKVGADYVTETTILEAVNSKTSADAGQGVFKVSGKVAVIKLSSSMEVGTYRLLFTVSNAYESIKVPYNFVVVN